MKSAYGWERKEATCSQCGELKRPTKAYLNLHKGEPYRCQACRASDPVPPMKIGKLGYVD